MTRNCKQCGARIDDRHPLARYCAEHAPAQKKGSNSGKSLRRAINEMCRECIVDPIGGGGTWRQQIEACTATKCPLYEYRPVSASTN